MEKKNLKRMVTASTLVVQVFCIFWFLLRGFVALVMIVGGWQDHPNSLNEFLRICYEVTWLGVLPVALFALVRRFLHGMIENKLFTEESYKISWNLFVLSACWPIFSILWAIFIGQISLHHWLDVVDYLLLPNIANLALVFILGVMHLVIKSGKAIQEDVDGFV